ncbi:MAG TPA: hypothetical protein VGJ13_04835 [Pseudonocardiaceae bacterium]|jgi:hypothetical protein
MRELQNPGGNRPDETSLPLAAMARYGAEQVLPWVSFGCVYLAGWQVMSVALAGLWLLVRHVSPVLVPRAASTALVQPGDRSPGRRDGRAPGRRSR